MCSTQGIYATEGTLVLTFSSLGLENSLPQSRPGTSSLVLARRKLYLSDTDTESALLMGFGRSLSAKTVVGTVTFSPTRTMISSPLWT